MKKLAILTACFCTFQFVNAQQDTTLKEYVGTYKFPDGSPVPSVEITIQDGNLFGNSANGSATLVKMSKDTFSIPSFSGMAYFKRNADGKVNGIKIELTDVTMEGEKESGVRSLESGVQSSYLQISEFTRYLLLATSYSLLTSQNPLSIAFQKKPIVDFRI